MNCLQSAVYRHIIVFSLAVCVLFVSIVEFLEGKMTHFLDDVHIVEALNEPVDSSGSEGDVSEAEYSPSESDSN